MHPYTSCMVKLPGWAVDDETAIRREASRYRGLSVEERAQLTAMACRSAARQLRARPDREQLLAYRDPLPESSVRALARLRVRHRESVHG